MKNLFESLNQSGVSMIISESNEVNPGRAVLRYVLTAFLSRSIGNTQKDLDKNDIFLSHFQKSKFLICELTKVNITIVNKNYVDNLKKHGKHNENQNCKKPETAKKMRGFHCQN